MLRKQHKVNDSHNDMPLVYYIEGHSLYFGHPEFALITGLIVTNLDVICVIEDEEMFRKLSDEDSIRLYLLLALEVIFMGRLLTSLVDDTLFRLVENLKAWNVFSWGEHVWIIESFERCNRWLINDPQVILRALDWSKKSQGQLLISDLLELSMNLPGGYTAMLFFNNTFPTFLRSSAKLNLSSSSNLLPSCALVKKNMISEFAEALTPL
ncbi:hypothetical protein Tco_1061434 [Tanacetum coccineum]